MQSKAGDNNKSEQVICPNCGSASITYTRRGYSALFGYIGANRMYYKCEKCGRKWKVGKR